MVDNGGVRRFLLTLLFLNSLMPKRVLIPRRTPRLWTMGPHPTISGGFPFGPERRTKMSGKPPERQAAQRVNFIDFIQAA